LRDREVLGLLGVSLLTFIILFGPQLTFLPILMDERFGAPSYLRGAVLSGASLTTALTSAQLGALTRRINERTLLKIAFFLYAAGLTLVALVPNVWLLVVPAVLFGVAQGINLPNVFSLLNAHAPSENRGAFMATNGMSLRAGQTIGPLIMAATAGTLGLTGAYLAATALAVVALLLVIPSSAEARYRWRRITVCYLGNAGLQQASTFLTGPSPVLLYPSARVQLRRGG
jgi:MFS transporter, ACDE family, multidrug resistance protein